MGLLLVILPNDRSSHGTVKDACKSLGIVYHCCLSYEAVVPTSLFLKKTARQIQSKVVKRAIRLQRLAIPFVPETPTVIFGADTHCAPGEDSIASVAAALDWPKVSKYGYLVSDQPHNEGIIDHPTLLGGMVSKLLHAFCTKTKRNAERIIFFRNCVNEGELDCICPLECIFWKEIDAIKWACASLAKGYEPPVTFVAVSPTPMFQGMSVINKHQHILPGRDNNCDLKPEFWCRHTGAKGVTSVIRYRVIYNENDITLHQLQTLTKMLCTPRDRRAYPHISRVPPAYYAYEAVLNVRIDKRKRKMC